MPRWRSLGCRAPLWIYRHNTEAPRWISGQDSGFLNRVRWFDSERGHRRRILLRVRVAGVDATKGGWVAVELVDGRFAGAHLIRPIETDFAALADVEVIAVDVPIGFGPRLADPAARRYLVGAASTVFSTPPRDVLATPFAPGLGVSAQAHALGPRILHVTELAERDPRVREVHPEVSFRAMNDGRRLEHRKKSSGGVIERLQVLKRHGIVVGDLGDAATAPIDDVLDDAAAAWSAERGACGAAESLPAPPEERHGRATAIWY